eukprot:CCRYP_009124-RB/>CCRYP_009124-RB protein AED:0.05 eAED:0.05 QI:233/1/1/1/1/1/4/588/512
MESKEPKYAEVQCVEALEVEDGIPANAASSPDGESGLASSIPTATEVDDYENEPKYGCITVTWEKGEVQSSEYRDKGFAIAFVTHLVALMGLALAFGRVAWMDANESSSDNEEKSQAYHSQEGANATFDTSDPAPKDFWYAVMIIALVASPVLSFLSLTVMSRNPIMLIKASLWFSIVLNIVAAVLLFATAQPYGGIIFTIFIVCLIWYARRVQNRIPYAAANLTTGITILKTNLGIVFVAVGSMVVLLGYFFLWISAFLGVLSLDVMHEITSSAYDDSEEQSVLSLLGGFVGFLFLLSLYWTHQVVKNVLRSTVSGVVGTFWFDPTEASSFCSSAVGHSFIRSTTYSLGSICFGSLIVALLHMLHKSLHRAQRTGGILRCIVHCILAYIEALVQYFNKWAYIYVGLYGYSYIDAGKRVANLFKTRGWQTIIADNLVNRLLGIISLTIGLLTGVCTLFAAFVVGEFESRQGLMGFGFVVGFFIGLIFSGVFMGLLSSAVDAVIVCYAEVSSC